MTTECRRCSDCEGQDHHWIEEPTYSAYDAGDEPLDDAELIGDRTCKHCPAIGMTCEDCGGEGVIVSYDEDGNDFESDCRACDGQGVIVVKGEANVVKGEAKP
jgi:hypothetical protein